MKKSDVIIRAPLLSYSGYGVHSRQIYKWLKSKDYNVITQIVQWGTTAWMVNPDLEGGLIGDIMGDSVPVIGVPDISFQIQLPDEWDNTIAKWNVGVTALVETDVCNPEWISCINKMDLVIVPSNHVKNTIDNTGKTSTPVIVVPESYIEAIDNKSVKALDLDIDTKFNLLIVGQFTGGNPESDRKNLFNTIKWLCESFEGDPDVGIIIKTNHGKGTRIDRAQTKKVLKQLISEIRKSDFPKIHLLHGNLTSEEMAGIYKSKKINGLVSLTRGEGFGLPLLEAAASALPVIVTNWSGHLDFMNLGKFIPIHYKLLNVSDSRLDGRIFVKGSSWCDPIEGDFKKKIKKFRNSYEKPRDWAQSLSSIIKEEFSQEAICKKYDEVIEKYIGT